MPWTCCTISVRVVPLATRTHPLSSTRPTLWPPTPVRTGLPPYTLPVSFTASHSTLTASPPPSHSTTFTAVWHRLNTLIKFTLSLLTQHPIFTALSSRFFFPLIQPASVTLTEAGSPPPPTVAVASFASLVQSCSHGPASGRYALASWGTLTCHKIMISVKNTRAVNFFIIL